MKLTNQDEDMIKATDLKLDEFSKEKPIAEGSKPAGEPKWNNGKP